LFHFYKKKNRTKLKLKTNIGTKLNHFDMAHNCGVTRVKRIQKKCGVDFTIVWSKLTAMTKLNHF